MTGLSSGVPGGSADSVPVSIAAPSANRDVINAEVAFGHHLFQVPKAEAKSEIPTDTKHDDLGFKMASLEQCRPFPSHPGQSLSGEPNADATQPEEILDQVTTSAYGPAS